MEVIVTLFLAPGMWEDTSGWGWRKRTEGGGLEKTHCGPNMSSSRSSKMSNSPHISVQHGAGVKGGESAAVGGLLRGVQLERLGGTAWKIMDKFTHKDI